MTEASPAECPGEETLAEFASGALPPDQAQEIEAHLDGCPACAWLAGRLIGDQSNVLGKSAHLDHEVQSSEASRYILHEVVGTGGMGTVYEAESVRLGRRVALKLLRDDPPKKGARERFLREARITAMLEHPNIVPVLEVGELEDGAPYYALRLVRGGTLGDALAACKDLASRLALISHFRDLCNAIGFAHGRGVIHRDIKPNNVLVGPFGETVVVDWGLARQRENPLEPLDHSPPSNSPGATRAGAALGTPGYMSPEQAAGRLEDVDERSDVYSLGAVLFELLMGRPPFSGISQDEILRRVVEEPPPLASAQGVPPDLAAIAAKALSRERSQRYPNASAMEADVASWIAGRRVAAYQYSPWHLMRRMAARYRTLAAGLLIALVVAGAWGGSAWGRRREKLREQADDLIDLALRYTSLSEWDRAATYFAMASITDDRAEGRWGVAAIGETGLVPLYKLKRHLGPVRAVAFSPDGAAIATASEDGTLRIDDVSSGRERLRLQPAEVPSFVAFASNGEVIAASGPALELFDLAKGALAAKLLLPGKVRALVVDHKRGLIAAAADSELIVWDRATRAELWRTHAEGPIDTLAFLPSGAIVFGGIAFDGLRSWSPPAQPIAQELEGLAFSRVSSCDGPRLAAVDAEGKPYVVQLDDPEPIILPAELNGTCHEVALSGDCRSVVCLAEDGATRIWDTETREQFADLAGSYRQALTAAFSPDSRMVVVGSADHAVRLWSMGLSRTHIGSRGEGIHPTALAWSPDGKSLASADRSGSLQLWDGATGHAGRVLDGHRGGSRAVAFAPDGTWASGGADGILLWSAEGKPLSKPSGDPTNALAFSPDGALAAGGKDGALRVFSRGKTLAPLPAHKGELLALAFSPDGSRLASGGADGKVLLWDPRGPTIVARIDAHEDEVRTLAFSPDNRWVASAGPDGTIRLWTARDGKPGFEVDTVRTGEVQTVAFVPLAAGAPAAGFLLGVSLRSSIEMWDPTRATRMLALDFNNTSYLSQLAVSPDGRRVALMHRDGVLSMFPLADVARPQDMQGELTHLLRLYKYQLGFNNNLARDEQLLRSASDVTEEKP